MAETVGYKGAPMTPEQCRAARALLGWSQKELSRICGVSSATIRNYESGRRALMPANAASIEHCFAAAGVEFIPGGVRRGGKES